MPASSSIATGAGVLVENVVVVEPLIEHSGVASPLDHCLVREGALHRAIHCLRVAPEFLEGRT
jgi:hypothetical protein